jgi:hypothetical protein
LNARGAAISSSVEVAPPKQKHCIHACPQARPVHRRTPEKGRIPQQADNPPGSIDAFGQGKIDDAEVPLTHGLDIDA